MSINTIRVTLNAARFDGVTQLTESLILNRTTEVDSGVYRIAVNASQNVGLFDMQTLLSPFLAAQGLGRPWLVIAASISLGGQGGIAGNTMGSSFGVNDVDQWIDISAISAGDNDLAVGKYLGPGYNIRVLGPTVLSAYFFQLEVARIEDNNVAAAAAALTTT